MFNLKWNIRLKVNSKNNTPHEILGILIQKFNYQSFQQLEEFYINIFRHSEIYWSNNKIYLIYILIFTVLNKISSQNHMGNFYFFKVSKIIFFICIEPCVISILYRNEYFIPFIFIEGTSSPQK